jgi:CheY-like chemotaxis protein/HAMP domain-containing protein/putative methionine-R-sulfoxide reductase with GAF domain
MSILNRFRIGTKVAGTVLIVLSLTALIAALGLTSLNQVNDRTGHIVDVSAAKVKLAGDLGRNLVEVVREEKNLILAETPSEVDQYTAETDERLAKIAERQALLEALADAEGFALLEQFGEHWQAYLALNWQVRELATAGETQKAIELSRGAARAAVNLALSDVKAIMAKDEADMAADKQASDADFARARNLMIGASFLAVAIGLALGLAVSRTITASLKEMVRISGEIAEGDVAQTVAVRSHDETGELAAAFNRFIDYLRDMAQVANSIAGGDLDVKVTPRSERDTLSLAVCQMVTDLRRVTAENERRIWQASGQSGLGDQMRGELAIPDLAQNVITYLCRYLEAQIGALYFSEDGDLKLAGSYAYTKRKSLSDRFQVGEGLVGQAALEKQPITISDVPDDYIRVQSGLGESPPHYILVIPFIYEDHVDGVIELGRFAEWTDAQVAFLESVTENVAIAFQVAQVRARTMELLEETQRQAEELQAQTEELEAQQEELRQANEELEEQAQALRESERRLQVQQEELQATNEELTEKTELLEQQRAAVEERNQELQIAQEKLERRAEELAAASKYKSEFLSNMSHELRTPLNSMLILARMLCDNEEGNLTEGQVESAQVIYDSGQDLLALINDILDLARIEAGRLERHLESIALADVLKAIERDFTPVAGEKGLEFQTRLVAEEGEGLPETIHTDRKRLEQVLKNLLSNAFKFTPEGSVTVIVHRPEAGVDLSHSGLDPAQTVAFSVADTGVGIAPEHHRAIFEAFQQVDGSISREYGGSGLGLSISRELARLLGGEIGLQSTLGEGSTFTLYVPEAPVEPAPPAPSVVEGSGAEGSTVEEPEPAPSVSVPDGPDDLAEGDRILLVVEDDPRFAKVLYNLGKDRGFRVLIAPTGETGLRLARAHTPAAVILDLKLPGISGWDVLASLKDDPDTRHIPVHIMSVEEETLDAYRRGAMSYLSKPVELADLERAFDALQTFLDRDVKILLIVEDDAATRKGLRLLIGNGDVECVEAETAHAALELLQERRVDCMILDLRLPDMSGFELLDRLETGKTLHKPPVIVYTGKELTREENEHLMKYAETVIVKGIRSEERLLDETALFLHRVVADLPPGKQQIIRHLHDRDAAFEGKRILLVDDDVRGSFALSKLLTERGLSVEIATDGQKALHLLATQPDVDVVLMDVMMPVMDGFETTRRIREQPQFGKLPILALTAKAMKGDREKCLAAGANDYISKPVDVDRLFSMLRVWLYR